MGVLRGWAFAYARGIPVCDLDRGGRSTGTFRPSSCLAFGVQRDKTEERRKKRGRRRKKSGEGIEKRKEKTEEGREASGERREVGAGRSLPCGRVVHVAIRRRAASDDCRFEALRKGVTAVGSKLYKRERRLSVGIFTKGSDGCHFESLQKGVTGGSFVWHNALIY